MNAVACSRIELAMTALAHNQSLITFVDGKANSLLLMNSIFLATGAAAARSALGLIGLSLAALALLLCVAVIAARGVGLTCRDPARLVFYQDILLRRSPGDYLADLRDQPEEAVLESTARQVYGLAGIVERKFRAYRRAQHVTLLAAGTWVANLLLPLLP
ncbi:MAG TPA: DUF5706 domain-containing protein [Myxococcota bacterium]|nr:DUF5706 domain-containing protein [Myxococcota bacterium]HRY92161.1 DUF5706 domain-containing protein [Myxococcota bacterium]HSA20647.1 DUF5706 domain-containing protein [Myxococcota bacterium]